MSTELFDHAAEQLERATELDRLEARGTLRLALKQTGLEAKNLTLQQLDVVFEKVMPGELETRGIDAAATTCRTVMAEIRRRAGSAGAPPTGSVDEVFRRLGGE
jgi:hypothetical protein